MKRVNRSEFEIKRRIWLAIGGFSRVVDRSADPTSVSFGIQRR